MKCVGLNPPSGGEGPGENNPADGYHAENCKEVASDACMAKCIKKRFNKPMPNYSVLQIGGGLNCQGWANSVLHGCLKECGAK